MAETDEPLTPTSRLFSQPLLDQVIHCAIAGDGPINLESIRSEIRSSNLLAHPRFCSLMVTDSAGRQYWRPTEVDIERHLFIHHHRISDDPDASDEDAVNDYVANLSVSSSLPTDKPLWELHILSAHNTAVLRMHHALGDGISLMSMLLSCSRRADDPTQTPKLDEISAAAVLRRRWSWSVWMVLNLIWFTLVYVFEFVIRLVCLRDKATALSGGAGVELWPRRLATARFQLDDMKTVKRAVKDSTINDVLFAIITRGLSRYLDITSHKALKEGDRITGLAMVNLRPLQGDHQDMTPNKWGNKFGIILLPVYYHTQGSDPLEFVRQAKAMTDRKKLSLEAQFSYKLMDIVTTLFGSKITSRLNYRILCNTTFTLSNMVGPRENVTLAGNPVKHIRVSTTSLPHAITMHMLSYAGIADMQILVAKEVIPDPKILAKCFQDALSEMKQAAIKS